MGAFAFTVLIGPWCWFTGVTVAGVLLWKHCTANEEGRPGAQ